MAEVEEVEVADDFPDKAATVATLRLRPPPTSLRAAVGCAFSKPVHDHQLHGFSTGGRMTLRSVPSSSVKVLD